MRITIIAVGKIRESWINQGVSEYYGRLKRFDKIELIELPEESVPIAYSAKEISRAMEKTGEKIISRLPDGAWTVALHPNGELLGSPGLANLLSQLAAAGTNHVAFVVGGSHGLAPLVLKHCKKRISFGPNIFPHRLFRVMLLEQIYRARKIMAGETYHK